MSAITYSDMTKNFVNDLVCDIRDLDSVYTEGDPYQTEEIDYLLDLALLLLARPVLVSLEVGLL